MASNRGGTILRRYRALRSRSLVIACCVGLFSAVLVAAPVQAGHECGLTPCLPGQQPTNTTYDDGKQVFNVKSPVFAGGAKGDGTNDDTAAIEAANAAATAAGNGVVWFPGGVYLFNKQLRATTSWIGSGPYASMLSFKPATPAGDGPVVIMGPELGQQGADTPRSITMRDLRLLGPKLWGSRQERGTLVDGIRVDGPYRLDGVSASNFDAAIVFNSPTGGITVSAARLAGNYYAVYNTSAGQDNFIIDSSLTGNFASVASPPQHPISGLTIHRTHLCMSHFGFFEEKAPPGFYDEPGTGAWLTDLHLSMARFEFCNSAMFYTENARDGGGDVRDLHIAWPGYSFGVNGGHPSYPVDYAMTFGRTDGHILFHDTYQAAGAPALATVYVHEQNASWEWLRRPDTPGPTITIGSGRRDTMDVVALELQRRRGRAVIPAGQTSTVVTIDRSLGLPESIFPHVQATSSGGVKKFTLLVSDVTSDPVAGSSFRVTVRGGVPETGLEFLWKVAQDNPQGWQHS